MFLKVKVTENTNSLLTLAEKSFTKKAPRRHVCFDFCKLCRGIPRPEMRARAQSSREILLFSATLTTGASNSQFEESIRYE